MAKTLRIFLLSLSLVSVALADAWENEAYVWQRRPGPAVAAAMQSNSSDLGGFCVLAAELGWNKDKSVVARVPLDFARLAALGKPIGLAFRFGSPDGTFSRGEDLALIEETLAAARVDGLEPAEVQIDYDCAESKLADYRKWLVTLRSAAPNTPLIFTALPAWLRHREEFVALAREASGFVLQVHSLEKPTSFDAPYTLCDSVRSLAWVRQADKLAQQAGVSFRIALPTYGYVLGFDASGERFIGLASEASRDWPSQAKLRIVRSDPVTMSKLAQQLRSEQLPQARGIIWFRLPIEDDRLAWSESTFRAVVRGDPLKLRLDTRLHFREPELAEVVVENKGQLAFPLPEQVRITWESDATPSYYEGIAGYDAHLGREREMAFRLSKRQSMRDEVAPGASRVIGWIRFVSSNEKLTTTPASHAATP